MAKSVRDGTLGYIYGHGSGWVLSQKDFTDKFSHVDIDVVLFSLEREGV
ncbi:MAG: hypothetical protein LBP39_03630 [Rickettsiales bacterium]|nr:hypothetical protein [Rickettsiales bacterium]